MRKLSRIAALAFLSYWTFFPNANAAPQLTTAWKPSALEIAQLPKYCWAQYNPELNGQPGYSTPVQLCGVGMNHMCTGLVYIIRARRATLSKTLRRESIVGARGELEYTVKRMPPECTLKRDLDAALQQVQSIERTLLR